MAYGGWLLAACIMAASSALSGCAIHPLPEDVTGVPTHTIVRKIRCEARAGIKKNLVDWLRSYPAGSPEYKLGVDFATGAKPLSSFGTTVFPASVNGVIQKLRKSAIVYDFTLDMTEVDNVDAAIDLLNPFHKGTSSAALAAGVDRSRENSRSFTLSDTFEDLLVKTREDYCRGYEETEPNYLYPITGRIGIDEVVHSFVELALFDNLAGSGGKTSGPPTMADTITFTTKLSGSAAPKVVFTPSGTAAHVADASITALASRTDVHKVIIGLALPPTKAEEPHAPGPQPGLFITVLGTPAQQAAGQAIDQAYLRLGVTRPAGSILIPVP